VGAEVQGSLPGFAPYRSAAPVGTLEPVPRFMLTHAHSADQCRVAAAAWKGFSSPLRHGRTVGSCASGGHRLWWMIEAPDVAGALAQLPPYLASRTTAEEVREVEIP